MDFVVWNFFWGVRKNDLCWFLFLFWGVWLSMVFEVEICYVICLSGYTAREQKFKRVGEYLFLSNTCMEDFIDD